jgi:bifunctional ADP-heptose synthase (sugar kinase/adenylyltransferase)
LTARAQKLRGDLGLSALLITRSEEGMTLYREGERLHVPAVAREVYDVSGAGDTVIAVLGVMLAGGAVLQKQSSLPTRPPASSWENSYRGGSFRRTLFLN